MGKLFVNHQDILFYGPLLLFNLSLGSLNPREHFCSRGEGRKGHGSEQGLLKIDYN